MTSKINIRGSLDMIDSYTRQISKKIQIEEIEHLCSLITHNTKEIREEIDPGSQRWGPEQKRRIKVDGVWEMSKI